MYRSCQPCLQAPQPVAPEHPGDLLGIVATRGEHRTEFLQVGDGIDAARHAGETVATVEIAAETHVTGIAGKLADVVHLGGKGLERDTIAQVAGLPVVVEEFAERHDADDAIPLEHAADDLVGQLAVAIVTGQQGSRVGMAGDDGPGVGVERLQDGLAVHVTQVEHEAQIGHGGEQGAPFVGERTGVARAAAEAGASPGGTDDAQTPFPPVFQFAG